MAITAGYKYNPEEDYTSPEQYKAQEEYAKALLYGSRQQPVKHWMQGVSNVVASLMGGKQMHDAGAGLTASRRSDADALAGATDSAAPVADAPVDVPTDAVAAEGGLAAPSAPAQQMAQALSKGRPKAPVAGPAPAYPAPGGETYIDPAFIPGRPMPTPQQMRVILSSPNVDPVMKQQLLQMWMQRNQPHQVPMGPGTVTIDPRNLRNQRFDSPIVKDEIGGGGTLGKVPSYHKWVPDRASPFGYKQIYPEGVAPPTVDLPPDQGPPDVKVPPHEVASEAVPPTEAAVPPEGIAAPPIAPEGVAPEAAPAGEGEQAPLSQEDFTSLHTMLQSLGVGTPGEGEVPAEEAPLETLPDEGGPPTEAAPGWMSPDAAQKLEWLKQQDVDLTARKEFAKKDAELLGKTLDDINKSAKVSLTLQSELQWMKKLIADPRFRHGSLSDIRVGVDRLLYTLGLDDQGSTINDAFEKVRASAVLDNMKAKLAGLGQVRLAEIALLNQAMASPANTAAANLAIAELAIRSAQHNDMIAKVAAGYQQGYRIGQDGNWVMGANGKPARYNTAPSNSELEANINNWLRANPLMSPQELDQYKTIFETDKLTGKRQAGAEAPNADKKNKGFFPTPKAGSPLTAQPPAPESRDSLIKQIEQLQPKR